MRRDLESRYDFRFWCDPRPEDASVLLIGFDPWREDCLGWRRENRMRLRETARWELRRSLWVPPSDPTKRVLIEVRETESSAAARACLLHELAQSERARLSVGPAGIGDVCFVHPEAETPAVLWATGNLCVRAVSIGLEAMPVLDWARRLHTRVSAKPKADRNDLPIRSRSPRIAVDREETVEVAWPAPSSDESFRQVFAGEARLRLKDDRIRVRAPREGPVAVEAFLVEPDRPARAGRLHLFAGEFPR